MSDDTGSPKQFQQRQPLYCHYDYYRSTVNKYLEYSNQHKVFGQWIEDNFDSDVVDVLAERYRHDISDHLRVLGIGSGEGTYVKDSIILLRLTRKIKLYNESTRPLSRVYYPVRIHI